MISGCLVLFLSPELRPQFGHLSELGCHPNGIGGAGDPETYIQSSDLKPLQAERDAGPGKGVDLSTLAPEPGYFSYAILSSC